MGDIYRPSVVKERGRFSPALIDCFSRPESWLEAKPGIPEAVAKQCAGVIRQLVRRHGPDMGELAGEPTGSQWSRYRKRSEADWLQLIYEYYMAEEPKVNSWQGELYGAKFTRPQDFIRQHKEQLTGLDEGSHLSPDFDPNPTECTDPYRVNPDKSKVNKGLGDNAGADPDSVHHRNSTEYYDTRPTPGGG